MIRRILNGVDTLLEAGRWMLGGAILLATAYWAVLAWRDRRGVDTRQLVGVDPETGLALRIGLTRSEAAAAREAERTVELVG